MHKSSIGQWSRRVVFAAVGVLALAGCAGPPSISPVAPTAIPEPTPPLACTLDCGIGHCAVQSGVAACVCPEGHSGARCESCAAGYQDRDGDGVCLPDCSMMTQLACGHGLCSSASGVPRCACDEGFDGVRCEACAPGYQDHDGDGQCVPGCSRVALDCHDHGVCDDSSGAVACACEPGFAASDCSACAAGLQDRDNDGVCAPDCATGSPGCGHGVCDDASGTPVCACPAGSIGLHCERCAEGYQDEDGDGVCRPDCAAAALACGAGSCSTAQGVARCQCTGGYAGEHCEQCAPGLQDFDLDGVCAPSCASGALSCGGYTVCDDASGQPECVCMPGYALHNEVCALLPMVADRTFSLSRWTPVGGAATTGLIPAEVVCRGSARLVSAVTLPQLSSPDAFAVSSLVVTPGDAFFPSESRALARVGESLAWLGASELGTSTVACLGEGAQIGPTEIQLSSASLSSLSCDPFTNADLQFQQLDVIAAAGCPRPGTVLDGRLDDGAWALSGEANVILAGWPVPSSSLHLWMADNCSTPRASTVLSVPRRSSLPSPALRFKMTGEAGRDLTLSVGLVGPAGQPLHGARLHVVAASDEEIVTRCLPDWTAGSAVALELTMRGNGVCSESDVHHFYFDDFEVVSDPSCAASTAGLFDPSFESDLERNWELQSASTASSETPEAGASTLGAHSGASSLRLSNARPCFSASARQTSRVPVGLPGNGPAVVGWYRAETLSNSTAALAATVLGAGYELALTPSVEWTRKVLCLPRELAGLPVAVEARQVATAGLCDDVFPREEIFFDDLEVTTDPTCP